MLQIFVFMLISVSAAQGQPKDVLDSLVGYLKASDAKNIAANFSSAVEMTILGDEKTYPKAQAEQIIRSFLSRNKPLNVRLIHRLSSHPMYKLGVFSVRTDTATFRITISLINSGEHFRIREIRIEDDKE